MIIYVKAGDREKTTSLTYESSLRDGHVLEFRPDEEVGKMIGYTIIAIRVPVDFWEVRGSTDWKSTQQTVLDLKKYTNATVDGLYRWEIPNITEPVVPPLRCDWFIDFKWLLDNNHITQPQYDSIYNFNEKTPVIDIPIDFTSFIFNEYDTTRLIAGIQNMAWTAGTKTVGSSGADYTTWKLALDDLGTLTGNATILGLTAGEILSNDVILINQNLAGYSITLGVTSGQEHNGGAYGNGARIN